MTSDSGTEGDRSEQVDIQFITYNNTQDGRVHDSKTRRLVRRQAKNASRHAHNSQLVPNLGDSSSVSGKTPSLRDSQSRFRLETPSRRRPQSALEDPVNLFISPFGPTIQALGHDAPILLSYYYAVYQYKCISINYESEWLSFILSNNAASHAFLALIALSYDADVKAPHSLRNARHSAAAVRLIGINLRDASGLPDDSIVCAVALLTLADSIQDDELSSTAHFRGLSEMLRLRGGGYDAFSRSRTLQKIISWARRIYCLRSNVPLSLPPVPTSSRASFDNLTEGPICPKYMPASITKRNEYGSMISRELEELLDRLYVLSSFPPGPSQTAADRLRISHIIYDAEYNLILLNQRHLSGLPGLSSDRTTLSKAYQLAVQIYILIALRRLKPESALVKRYVQVLRSDSGCRQLPNENLDSTSYRSWIVLLLWIETVLAVATADLDNTSESVVRLRILLESVGCSALHEFMEILKEVCWLDGYLEDVISALWSTIMQGTAV